MPFFWGLKSSELALTQALTHIRLTPRNYYMSSIGNSFLSSWQIDNGLEPFCWGCSLPQTCPTLFPSSYGRNELLGPGTRVSFHMNLFALVFMSLLERGSWRQWCSHSRNFCPDVQLLLNLKPLWGVFGQLTNTGFKGNGRARTGKLSYTPWIKRARHIATQCQIFWIGFRPESSISSMGISDRTECGWI